MRYLKQFILILCALALPASALAKVDFIKSPPLHLKQPVKAITSSFDGSTFFVLGQNSVLYMYNARGEKQGETPVDPSMDIITTSGFKKANIPEFIYLTSSKTGTVQKIAFSKIVQFDLSGSPFIGNAEAKVAVVIFSDFQ